MDKKDLLRNVMVLFITLAVLLLLFEGIARVSYPLYSDYNTEMWRYSLEVKRISDNPNLVHEHRPNAGAYLYGAQITTNSDGLRDREYSKQKNASVFRILALGDSVTLGWGVDANETYSERIEKELDARAKKGEFLGYRSVEVINTGVGNYNTQMELEVLKEKGLSYHPNLIMLGYYINDAEVGYPKVEPSILKRTYLYALLWDKIQNIKVKVSERGNYASYYHALYEDDFEGKKKADSSLREIIRLSKEKKIPILIIIFPEFHQFENYQFGEVTDFVEDIAKEGNVTPFDLLPYYQGHDPSSIWVSYEDAHPNGQGHGIASDAIVNEIVRLKFMALGKEKIK